VRSMLGTFSRVSGLTTMSPRESVKACGVTESETVIVSKTEPGCNSKSTFRVAPAITATLRRDTVRNPTRRAAML